MKYSLILVVTCLFLTACEKEFSLENFKPALPETRKYQIRAFYSDIPVDFIETDEEVKSETDLWVYVKDYLKDDIDEFTADSTQVLIYQNEKKIPGNEDPILYKTYSTGTDQNGQYIQFLGPDYEPLRYRLHEWNEDYFIISIKWRHGSTIYTRFERIR